MIETASREISDVRSLLLDPTPENFEEVTRKLSNVASLLANMAAGNVPDDEKKPVQAFLCRLPGEMAALRKLTEAPLKFYEGLESLRAAKFGSYERTGTLKTLEPKPPASTLIHL
jgi:hypothetical protein